MTHRLKARRAASATLRNANEFATAEQQFPAADPCKAHLPRPSRARTTSNRLVDVARHSEIGERALPELTDPHHRPTDVVDPQRVTSGYHEVEPDKFAGHKQHRSPATASLDHCDTERTRNAISNVGVALR